MPRSARSFALPRKSFATKARSLSRANGAGAAYALIIGDDELDRGEAQLKDLATGEQRAVSLDLIGEALKA